MTSEQMRDVMREVAGRRGWGLETQLNLALDFINDLDASEEFRPFLEGIAKEEVSIEEWGTAEDAEAGAGPAAPPTREACLALMQREYDAHAGGVLLVQLVEGLHYAYTTGGFGGPASVEVELDPPLRVRVVAQYEPAEEMEDTDGWLDPRWYVEPLEARAALAGIESLFVFGTSFNPATGGVEPTTTWMPAV